MAKALKERNTGIYDLLFAVNGQRLCFLVGDRTGRKQTRKRFWVDMPPRMAKAVGEILAEHDREEARRAAMTPQELARMYEERMGT